MAHQKCRNLLRPHSRAGGVGGQAAGPEPAPTNVCYYDQPELWDAKRYEGSPLQRLRARSVAMMLDADLESVLDVGCGNGFITRQLRARRVVGLDASAEALSQVRGEAVLGTCDQLPFQDGEFEAVVCCEVLEHLPPTVFAATREELRRVARRCLVLGVPYREDLRESLTRCPSCHAVYHTALHQRSFNSPHDLAALFPGFELEAVAYIGRQTRIRSTLFRHGRQWLTGSRADASLARCPQCGAAGTTAPKVRNRLVDGLAWRLAKETKPAWMNLLLVRPDATGSPPPTR